MSSNGGNNNGGSGSLRLKLDKTVKREPDRSARNIPVQKLTEAEMKKLASECFDKCLRAYKKRMMASALLADYEEHTDLDGEAWIAMWNILRKFDKSKCGKISKFDEPGKTNPKTLKFYFLNYFYGRVNFIACEARAFKKLVGVGPAESFSEVTYDEEDTGSVSEYNHKYEVTGIILSELKKRDEKFQRFFYQLYKLQITQKELREEYGEEFTVLKNHMNRFIEEIKHKNKGDNFFKKG